MLKIGEFSKASKTTIKTLRFYDEKNLFKPMKIDENGYRYYDISQLETLLQILNYRKLGFSIKEIKTLLTVNDKQEILCAHLQKLIDEKNTVSNNILSLQKIIKEGEVMKNYIVLEKVLPDYNAYYRHGTISSMDKLTEFVLEAGMETQKYNPTLQCEDYCFVTYTAKEYKERNIELEYVEAVKGKVVESENIKSKFIKGGKALCVEHKGSYAELRNAYSFILNYIKEHNIEIIDDIREVYIDGCWNKENEEDYLTEIQVPIK